MSDYLEDPRLADAERRVFEAEALERQGNLIGASSLWRAASDLYSSVGFEVPASLPKTRTVWAVSAVAAASRARDFAHATDLAERFLAEDASLTEGGREELRDLLRVARSLREDAASRPARGKLLRWRDEIRNAA